MTTNEAKNAASTYLLAAVEDHSSISLADLSRRASADFVAAITAEGKAALAFAMQHIDALILCQL